MLFQDDIFILVFLPLWLITIACAPQKYRIGLAGIITLFSLCFYAADGIHNLPILIGSILVNFAILRIFILSKTPKWVQWGRYSAIIFNLAYLGFYKYLCFASEIFLLFIDIQQTCLPRLPLGISFFTFQQLALLLTIARIRRGGRERSAKNYKFLDYFSFVSFFPQLIAGPIANERELFVPIREKTMKISLRGLEIGALIFIIGICKKICLADSLDQIATPLYAAAGQGMLDTQSAWLAAYSFSLQVYFDFSSYSDMAVGLAAMVSVALPWNFKSPFKSVSYIQFWQMWHATLNRFFLNHLAIWLDHKNKHKYLSHANILIIITLSGLWHGATWAFVLWGFLNGVILWITFLLQPYIPKYTGLKARLLHVSGWFFVYNSFVILSVLFRTSDAVTIRNMYQSMFLINSKINLETTNLARILHAYKREAQELFTSFNVNITLSPSVMEYFVTAHVLALLILVLAAPNTKKLAEYYTQLSSPKEAKTKQKTKLTSSHMLYALRLVIWIALACALASALYFGSSAVQKFIYFNF